MPYSFDLGNLLINDVNPLPGTGTGAVPDEQLAALARETAQALINQLLTVCTVVKGSATKTTAGPALMLPAPSTALPRAKRVPVARAPTKWEQFAAKKGIAPKAKDGKTVYDDEKGEWVPKWGYKGKNKDGENDWLVEVDEKKENADRERKAAGKGPGAAAAALTDVPVGQTLKRQERKENIRKNERRMKHNEKRARKSASSR